MEIIKPLIALLAIVNPIGVIPFFIHFTQGFSREQRQRTIRVAAIGAFLVISVSALAGLKIIEFFGISLASFQVGGGMLLLMSSLQMLNAQPAESRRADFAEGGDKVDAGDSIAVVPLTIPLLTGPDAIRFQRTLPTNAGNSLTRPSDITSTASAASSRPISRVMTLMPVRPTTRAMRPARPKAIQIASAMTTP